MFRLKILLIIIFSRFHTFVLERSTGKFMNTLLGQKMMLISTIGRKSGKIRKTPLLYINHQDDIYCAASFAGNDKHPDWCLNLIKTPNIEIFVEGKCRKVKSEFLAGTERGGAWDMLCKTYSPYNDYQDRANREIPVIKFTYV
jgi:deazaflavin-dependent oxidoreductase (nitroreductase family)